MISRLKWHCSHVCVHSHTDLLRPTVEYVQGIVSSQNVCICYFVSRLVVQRVAMASLFVGRPCCRRTILILGIEHTVNVLYPLHVCVCANCAVKKGHVISRLFMRFTCILLHQNVYSKRFLSFQCNYIYSLLQGESSISSSSNISRKKVPTPKLEFE